MSATLPSNLARVGEDLARATQRDAQRSAKRRRYATAAVVLALLALTATTAIANGWLFGSEPALKAAPAWCRAGVTRPPLRARRSRKRTSWRAPRRSTGQVSPALRGLRWEPSTRARRGRS